MKWTKIRSQTTNKVKGRYPCCSYQDTTNNIILIKSIKLLINSVDICLLLKLFYYECKIAYMYRMTKSHMSFVLKLFVEYFVKAYKVYVIMHCRYTFLYFIYMN